MQQNTPDTKTDAQTETTHSTATTTSPAAGTPYDAVETVTSGVVLGTPVEAFEIISGSTFPVDDDAFIRVTSGDNHEYELEFSIDIDPDSITTHQKHDGRDIFISEPHEDVYTTADTAILTERVTVQSPYESVGLFKVIKSQSDLAATFTNSLMPKWHVKTEHINMLVEKALTGSFSVVMRLHTARRLFDAHADHTVGTGAPVITDAAPIEPDEYIKTDRETGTGHGKGGNPHNVKYYLKRGECPADGCDYETDLFRSLRGHIGGKCRGGCEAHQDLNVRIAEVEIQSEEDLGGDFD